MAETRRARMTRGHRLRMTGAAEIEAAGLDPTTQFLAHLLLMVEVHEVEEGRRITYREVLLAVARGDRIF